MKNTIEIPFNKKRIFITFMGMLIFDGILYHYHQQIIAFVLASNSLKAVIFSILIIVLLILFSLFLMYHLFKPRTLLVIDDLGYTDQSHTTSIGCIKWKDIIEIKQKKDLFDEVLLVFVKNPEVYLSKVSNKLSLKMLLKNKEIYGTCFLLKPKLFKYDTVELINLIFNEHRKHGYSKKSS